MEGENNEWNRIETNNPELFKTSLVSEDVAKGLVCCGCKNFLSVKPVSINTETKGLFCGRCRPVVDEKLIDYSYYSLSESFVFPCQNAKYGCRTKLGYDKMKIHESQCDFVRIECPICWIKSSLEEIINHLLVTHRDSLHFATNKFHVSQNKNCVESKLLLLDGKYYVVKLDICRESFTISINHLDSRLGDFHYALMVKTQSKKNKKELKKTGKKSESIKFLHQDIFQELESRRFYFEICDIEDSKPQVVAESELKLEVVQE